MALLDFTKQVAIVTGAGRNLGRGYAIDLARRGARVVVNDIDEQAAADVVDEINQAGGVAVIACATVATEAGGSSIVQTAIDRFGGVDILINNAGNVRAGNFATMPVADFDDVIAVHLRGAFCVTQPAWRHMQQQGYGRIVMSGSAAGAYPEQGYSEYATAKAGLIGMTRALAAEGAEHGILVNMINPQAGGSGMTADAKPMQSVEDMRFAGPDKALAPYKSVEAVSALVQYLCSPQCDRSGLILAAGAGWYGRVFLGLNGGWSVPAPGMRAFPEDVAAHIDTIVATRDHIVPQGASEELHHIASQLGLLADAGDGLAAGSRHA